MNNKKAIYLADLTHTANGIMALTFPLGTAKFLLDHDAYTEDLMDYFNQLGKFILCKKKEISNPGQIIVESFDYDFEKLESVNFEINPKEIKKAETRVHFRFFHDNEQQSLINNAIGLYNNHTDGMARMLYSNNLQKLYRNFERVLSTAV